MRKAKALVLFDIDGTLLRGAGGHHRQALIDGIRSITGIETHLNGVATSGMLDCDLIRLMLRAADYPGQQTERAMREIVGACQTAYLGNCAPDLRNTVCGGARELLEALRKNDIAAGLVTGNLSQISWKKMELAALREYFSVGAFAEDGTTRAEVARVAWELAQRSRLIEPDARVSLIGDHMNDVYAAKVNGFVSIAVASGLTSAEQLAEARPDILVSSLTELLEKRFDLFHFGVSETER